MYKKPQIILIPIFLLLVLTVWVSFFAMNKPEVITLEKTDGTTDLSNENFQDKVFRHRGYWESYEEELLTPKEFEEMTSNTKPVVIDNDDGKIEYSTHRTKLILKPKKVYALHMKTADYSMKIFINGEEIDTVGKPGKTKATNIPRTAEKTYYFYPEQEVTSIVVQTANFVHNEGGSPPHFFVGLGDEIDSYTEYHHIITFLITGCLLTGFLFYLSFYILNRNRLTALVFAISCLMMAFKTNKLLPLFWEDYNWYVAIRVEYIVHFLCFATLTLFLSLLFVELFNKYIIRGYLGVCLLFMLTLFLPTKIFTGFLIYFQIISVILAIYIFIKLAISLREKQTENILAFTGLTLVGLFAVNDILSTMGINFLGNIGGQIFTVPIGMVFFVFCYSLVVSIHYAKAQHTIDQAKIRIKEIEEEYTKSINESKNNAPKFSISKLNLSEREQDVAWLLIDGKSRKEISYMLGISPGTVNTYCSRIYSKTGSNSFADFIKKTGM